RGDPQPLIVLDSFEHVESLGGYLRRALVPSLPRGAAVLIGSRRAPGPEWQARGGGGRVAGSGGGGGTVAERKPTGAGARCRLGPAARPGRGAAGARQGGAWRRAGGAAGGI